MLIKSLLRDGPKLSITTGRLVTGTLPLRRSLAPEHSWASTGGPEGEWSQHGHPGGRGRTKWGRVGLGVNRKTREALPPPFTEGEWPRPAFYTHQLLAESCDLGLFHDVDDVRVRLLFVQIYAHNHSSCAFQLCIFLMSRNIPD